jgi:hypothetical protein
VIPPLTCDGGCGEEIGGRVIVIEGGCFCDLCASEIALKLLDNPNVPERARHVANVVLAIVKARRLLKVERQRGEKVHEEIAKRGMPAGATADSALQLPVLNRRMCLACARESCAKAGFGGLDQMQSGHVCGRES